MGMVKFYDKGEISMERLKSVNWKYVFDHVMEFVFSFTLWVALYTFVIYKIITSE